VPDPFLKRVLTVANREVLALARREGARIGFKDLGAGGISCVTSELADAGGFGCDVDLADVHAAGADIPARVIACSETQERYGLAVPARLTAAVLKIYNEDFALPTLYEGACARRIGRVTKDRQYVLRFADRVLCRAPVETITSGIRYERSYRAPARSVAPPEARLAEAPVETLASEWLAVMGHPNVASREYLYRHYDSEVQGNTVLRPGEADAGVVAPLAGCPRGVALAADGNPRYGLVDPYLAGAMAVIEVCRNVACVGGVPAAITDCLNFGNPEQPEVFWQFREAVRGIADACHGLGRLPAPLEPLPVVSGNVSFYNQSRSGRTVAPSPIVACVGIVADWSRARSQHFKAAGDRVYLLGAPGPWLEGSVYREAGFAAGHPSPPRPDFAAGLVSAAHDVSDGGLAVALAEMAVGLEGQSSLGADLKIPADLSDLTLREVLFNEQGGFVVTVPAGATGTAEQLLGRFGARWWRLGVVTTDPNLAVGQPARGEAVTVSVMELARAWRGGGHPRGRGGPRRGPGAERHRERPGAGRSGADDPPGGKRQSPHRGLAAARSQLRNGIRPRGRGRGGTTGDISLDPNGGGIGGF
jgi:phosphoribosylformylglycinamidine (FGAM) synthase-like enzyme